MIESVQICVADAHTHEAALALPTDGEAPFPGVVVIHDIYGLSPDLKRHCRRFFRFFSFMAAFRLTRSMKGFY